MIFRQLIFHWIKFRPCLQNVNKENLVNLGKKLSCVQREGLHALNKCVSGNMKSNPICTCRGKSCVQHVEFFTFCIACSVTYASKCGPRNVKSQIPSQHFLQWCIALFHFHTGNNISRRDKHDYCIIPLHLYFSTTRPEGILVNKP